LHTPALQPVVPLALLQTVPQAPQFALLLSEVSQPLPALLSQLPQPLEQVIPHCPPTQLGEPLTPLHAVGHAPQCNALDNRFVSHPLSGVPSQLP
jgi:hypothetical protein